MRLALCCYPCLPGQTPIFVFVKGTHLRGLGFSKIVSEPGDDFDPRACLILRYVLSGKPTERFLEFLNMIGHSAVDMESSILDYFDKHTIDISNCRGQSYDNASNMSGRYNGLQARIKEKNPLADYVPCFAHSLNLVGQSAVEKVSGAARFFNLVDYVYTCFSASTHRWSVLLDSLLLSS